MAFLHDFQGRTDGDRFTCLYPDSLTGALVSREATFRHISTTQPHLIRVLLHRRRSTLLPAQHETWEWAKVRDLVWL